MSRVIFVRKPGGPEAMELAERDLGSPGKGEIKVRNRAIGINFIDVYQRSGVYKLDLPFVPGSEGAGEVLAVGEGVTDFKPGDRVGYTGPIGAYAEERLLPAEKAVPLPDGIDFETAAAVMLKGGTAWYLLFETWAVKPGETMLVHAAAGGVGSLLVQWGRALGARVLATAGSAEKVVLALEHGAEEAFDSRHEDWVAGVRAATGGKGVDVVYDGVGKATFEGSLDCLRPRGLLASFGSASGAASIANLGMLATKGSLYVTRPTMGHYLGTSAALRHGMAAVFEAVTSGKLKVSVNQRFPLAEAGEAHRALEGRETTGSTVLMP